MPSGCMVGTCVKPTFLWFKLNRTLWFVSSTVFELFAIVPNLRRVLLLRPSQLVFLRQLTIVGTREGHFPRIFSNIFIDNHDEEEALVNILTMYQCVRIQFQELTCSPLVLFPVFIMEQKTPVFFILSP